MTKPKEIVQDASKQISQISKTLQNNYKLHSLTVENMFFFFFLNWHTQKNNNQKPPFESLVPHYIYIGYRRGRMWVVVVSSESMFFTVFSCRYQIIYPKGQIVITTQRAFSNPLHVRSKSADFY